MSRRLLIALALSLALLGAGAAGAQSPAGGAGATARAYAIRVIAPGLPTSSTPVVASPPQSQVAAGGAAFSFNAADGTPVVTTGAYMATANADASGNPFATASAEVIDLSLFGGEVTASDVVAALRGANIQVAAGAINQPPATSPGGFELAVQTLGRLSSPVTKPW